ncbi:phage head-tail joining protein [Mesorhizobium argentiipisi]|uniref:Phage tail protein n=1 Tax=Mesorhizobium argentiipisi TaxID=3015175 RepID=A0ABU8KCC1_9HYPH
MATLAELQSQLDTLRRARATGLRSAQHGDSKTEYRSDAELAAAIADLERQIAGVNGRGPGGVFYFTSSKGLST